MPFCPKCGKPLPDKALFCPSCGEKVANDVPATPAPTTSSLAGPAQSESATTAPAKLPDKNSGFTKQMNMSLQSVLAGSVLLLVASVFRLSGKVDSWIPSVFMGIGVLVAIYGIVTFLTYPNKHVFVEEEMPQYAKAGQPSYSPTEAKNLSWQGKMKLAYRKTSTIVLTVVAGLALVGTGSFAISTLVGGQIIGYYIGNGTVGDLGDWRSYDVKLEQDGTVLRYQHIVANNYETTVAGTGSWTYKNSELTITLDPSWEKLNYEEDVTTYVRSTSSDGIFWNLKSDPSSSTYCWYGPTNELTYSVRD